jgi:hypothetical protein
MINYLKWAFWPDDKWDRFFLWQGYIGSIIVITLYAVGILKP